MIDLSNERGDVRWFVQPPSFLCYVRMLEVWPESYMPCPRSLFAAEILGITTNASTGQAARVFYLLSDHPRDGIDDPPSGDDPHGGKLIHVDSVAGNRVPVPYVPSISEPELLRWTARRDGYRQYWQRFRKAMVNFPKRKPQVPVMPPEKPRGMFARFFGKG